MCHIMKELIVTYTKQEQAHNAAKSRIPHSLSHCSWNLQVNRQLHSQNLSCSERTWLMLRWLSPKERLFLGSLAKKIQVFSPSMHCQITNSTKLFITKRKKKKKRQQNNEIFLLTILGNSLPTSNYPSAFRISFTELCIYLPCRTVVFESQAGSRLIRIACLSMSWRNHGAFLFKVRMWLEQDQFHFQGLQGCGPQMKNSKPLSETVKIL